MSKGELDLMMLLFIFSDQHGNVDTKRCNDWSKQKLGITIPQRQITITQEHVNSMIHHGVLPDTNSLLARFRNKGKV